MNSAKDTNERNFLSRFDEVLLIHLEILKETGGSEGLRDPGGLESALKAAENRLFYETDDLAILAATYAYHLSQAHAFIDGNKRIAAVVAELFLKMNGAKLSATMMKLSSFSSTLPPVVYRAKMWKKDLPNGW